MTCTLWSIEAGDEGKGKRTKQMLHACHSPWVSVPSTVQVWRRVISLICALWVYHYSACLENTPLHSRLTCTWHMWQSNHSIAHIPFHSTPYSMASEWNLGAVINKLIKVDICLLIFMFYCVKPFMGNQCERDNLNSLPSECEHEE